MPATWATNDCRVCLYLQTMYMITSTRCISQVEEMRCCIFTVKGFLMCSPVSCICYSLKYVIGVNMLCRSKGPRCSMLLAETVWKWWNCWLGKELRQMHKTQWVHSTLINQAACFGQVNQVFWAAAFEAALRIFEYRWCNVMLCQVLDTSQIGMQAAHLLIYRIKAPSDT